MSRFEYQSNTRLNKLIIISNRLPVTLTRVDTGEWQTKPSPGGLVTALAPVLREKGGSWIGWTGWFEELNLDDVLTIAS